MAASEHDPMRAKLEAVGWGVFFIWIGTAFLADVGWPVGLLGVGVIALGGQLARSVFGVPVDRFGLVIGIVFVVWGASEALDLRLGETPISSNLLPVLSIIVGAVLAASALLRKA